MRLIDIDGEQPLKSVSVYLTPDEADRMGDTARAAALHMFDDEAATDQLLREFEVIRR